LGRECVNSVLGLYSSNAVRFFKYHCTLHQAEEPGTDDSRPASPDVYPLTPAPRSPPEGTPDGGGALLRKSESVCLSGGVGGVAERLEAAHEGLMPEAAGHPAKLGAAETAASEEFDASSSIFQCALRHFSV
jgi:hypothetical protein